MLRCKDVRMQECNHASSPGCQSARLPGRQVLGCQDVKMQGCQDARIPTRMAGLKVAIARHRLALNPACDPSLGEKYKINSCRRISNPGFLSLVFGDAISCCLGGSGMLTPYSILVGSRSAVHQWAASTHLF